MSMRVVVVGAGAFGGWTALNLLRKGADVTMIDAWGPGNSRASSGGDTRVIRSVYGRDRIFVEMVSRAFDLWQTFEKQRKIKLYHDTGMLWLASKDGSYVQGSIPYLTEAGLSIHQLSPDEVSRRYPQISMNGVGSAFVEEKAGYLLARRACEAVAEAFLAEGGKYLQRSVTKVGTENGKASRILLSDGSSVRADLFIFACGPWLGKIFPDVVGDVIQSRRQEVYYFGTPAGDPRFTEAGMPVWAEIGPPSYYGIPGSERRGFKIAKDVPGEPFDPTSGDRTPTPRILDSVREHLARRFPALADAPIVEARICQYELTPDRNLVIDSHPEIPNVWIVGGGSGHGFKLGPVVGEWVAEMVIGERDHVPAFLLHRFKERSKAWVEGLFEG